MRIFLIAAALTAMGALIIAAKRATERAVARRTAAMKIAAVTVQAPRSEPIAAEAFVFRTRPGALAIDPTSDFRRAAHPRTLATFRSLRAYPGAPPRIPHGLTPVEFTTGGCKTCHERGGFSQRFGAYVPVTPHPEMSACLQCHVGDDKLMAIALPNTEPSARCRQCHALGATRWTDSTLNWKPQAWPELPRNVPGRNPPPIPHRLQMRENCIACHAAPSGVEEIRTPHAERANCRQCHVEANGGSDAGTDASARTRRQVSGAAGGTR